MATTGMWRTPGRVRLALAAQLSRRAVGEISVGVLVVLGTAIVLAAAERRSPLSSPHDGRFTDWFAGPLHGLLPSLTRNTAVLEHGVHAPTQQRVASADHCEAKPLDDRGAAGWRQPPLLRERRVAFGGGHASHAHGSDEHRRRPEDAFACYRSSGTSPRR